MRQYKPKLNVSQSVGQTSPPQTPRAASPASSRTGSSHIRDFQYPAKDPMSRASNIRPLGHGPQFSYTRPMGPEDLSPRSSSSSSAGSDAISSDDDSSDSDSPSSGSAHNDAAPPPPAPLPPSPPLFAPRVRTGRVVTEAAFVLEELSDFDSSADDDDRRGAVRPYQVEDAESERSRSLSRPPAARAEASVVDHRTVTRDLRNLHCSDSEPSSDDDSDLDDAEFQEMLMRRRLEKRHRRMTSGSIGKRTISESIGSDSDREDLKFVDANEMGSSARRLRRRLGDRRSLLFQDPPPRIDELEETIDEWDTEALARELPYYTLEYISMEVDSP